MTAPLKRRVKEALKRIWRRVFDVGQRAGVDILPRHFYSSIPDFRELRADPVWRQPLSMRGVRGADVDAQLEFAREICTPWREDVRPGVHAHYCQVAGEVGYGPTEADCLFAFIASKRPPRIVQVGCGVSTAIILGAAQRAGYRPQLVCVEPYPSRFLREMAQEGRLQLVPQKAQQAELAQLTDLRPGDLLFVDSTHTVKPGSEVNRIVLEVLPRLTAGVLVHFHDIYFPYDYPRDMDTTLVFPCESTLLHAFLAGNPRYTIRLSLSMLHYARPEALRELLPNYQPQANRDGLAGSPAGHFPNAVYLEVLPADSAPG